MRWIGGGGGEVVLRCGAVCVVEVGVEEVGEGEKVGKGCGCGGCGEEEGGCGWLGVGFG